MMVGMRPKRAFGPKGVSLALALALLLFTPLLGGSWWWPHLVVGVTLALALVPVRGRARRRIERCAGDPR